MSNPPSTRNTERPASETSSPELHAVPAPWEYNPSTWNQRVRVAAVAAVAFFIAVYMGLYQLRLIPGVWDPIFGEQSEYVLDSNVSETMSRWFRTPDAILGALAYLGDIIFALGGSTSRWQFRPWLVVIFGLDVIPLGIVSAILVVLQGAIVGAWCFLCLVTAVLSLVLVVLAYDEVWSCLRYLYRVWKTRDNLHTVWDAFWGRPSQIAHDAGRYIIEARG
jgi:uncharacterized membrane protein